MSERQQNLGCINPHGHYPFPASRDVCPACQEIQTRLREAVFSPRHGLRYHWWRDIPWPLIVSCIVTLLFSFMLAYVITAWWLDLKWSDLPW